MEKFRSLRIARGSEIWEINAGEIPQLRRFSDGAGWTEKSVTPDDAADLAFLLRDAEDVPPEGAPVEFTAENGESRFFGERAAEAAARFCRALWNGTRELFSVSLSSFDGGGPSYEAKMTPTGIVTYQWVKRYYDPDHESLCGAGFDVTFTFRPLRPGRAKARITGQAFYGEEPPLLIAFTVDEDLRLAHEEKNETNQE